VDRPLTLALTQRFHEANSMEDLKALDELVIQGITDGNLDAADIAWILAETERDVKRVKTRNTFRQKAWGYLARNWSRSKPDLK